MASRGKAVNAVVCCVAVILALLPVSCGGARPSESVPYTVWPAVVADGDLAFVVRSTANAITAATCSAADSFAVDHVAILLRDGTGRLLALEADELVGVTLSSADSLLQRACDTVRGRDGLLIARVSGLDVNVSLQRALALLGKPYDDLYLSGDSAIYCSELVQAAFVDTLGRAVFNPAPMNFCGPDGVVLPEWQEHYARHGLTVPQNHPGSNPAALARHSAVVPLQRDLP